MRSRWTAALAAGAVALATAAAEAGPSLVVDSANGAVLSADRAGAPWYPASLTKLMTAYVTFNALEAGKVKLETPIVMTERARLQPPSKLGLPAGATITVDWALRALIGYSANDVAVALAEGVGGDVPTFVRQMNEASRELGMAGTYFANPNGLPDDRQVTTARDMAVLASAIIRKFPQHQHYFKLQHVAMGKRRLRARNSLLRRMPTADGMKTGFICASGFNLVASATENGRRLIAVVMGAKNDPQRAAAAQSLLQSGFGNGSGNGNGSGSGMIEADEHAARRPANVPRENLAQLKDDGLGETPSDLSSQVCRRRNYVRFGDPTQLSGWGASLGRFNSSTEAFQALRTQLIATRNVFYGGATGVVPVPGGGFLAAVWDAQQSQMPRLCENVRERGGVCELMMPENFAEIARQAEVQAAERRAQAAARNAQRQAERAQKQAEKQAQKAQKVAQKEQPAALKEQPETQKEQPTTQKAQPAAQKAKKGQPLAQKAQPLAQKPHKGQPVAQKAHKGQPQATP